MKNLIFAIITFSLLPFFFSCDNSDDDNEPPKIEVISINDTLYLDSTFSAKDSLAAASLNLLKIKFTDNKSLSSYSLRIKPGTDFINPDSLIKPEGGGYDSLAYSGTIKPQRVNIFGRDSITIANNLYISSNFSLYNRETNKNVQYIMRAGKYILSISCIDNAGNIDSIQSRQVVVLHKPK